MSIKKVLSILWKDSVFSKLIANIIWALPTILIAISPFSTVLNKFFKVKIAFYYSMIFITLMLLILTIVFSKYLKLKKMLITKDKSISELEDKLSQYISIQHNKRFKMFNLGDVVKMKTAPISNYIKYTVIDRTSDGIVLVDMNNNKMTCHPEAIMTSDEYLKEENDWCETNRRARQMTQGKWI